MRRTFVTLLATAGLLAWSGAAHAQTIGFKLGMTNATASLDPDDDEIGSISAFGGGGFIRFDLGRIGIQPELLWLKKGVSVEDPEDAADLELEYIEVPVLLHFPLMVGTSFAPYVFGGPAFSFEVGCQFSNGAEVECDDPAADTFGERAGIDFGITGGGGLAFAFGPGSLLVEGRYTWGMTDISEEDDTFELKNRAWFFAAGFAIPLTPSF